MAENPETKVKPVDTESVSVIPRHSEWRRVARVFFGRRLALIGFIIVMTLVLTAIFAPWIATHDPYKTDLRNKLAKPGREHFLGTDATGREAWPWDWQRRTLAAGYSPLS